MHVRLTVQVVETGEIIVHLRTKADPRDRQARSIEQLDSCEKKLRMCPGSRNTQELARAKLVASHKAVGGGGACCTPLICLSRFSSKVDELVNLGTCLCIRTKTQPLHSALEGVEVAAEGARVVIGVPPIAVPSRVFLACLGSVGVVDSLSAFADLRSMALANNIGLVVVLQIVSRLEPPGHLPTTLPTKEVQLCTTCAQPTSPSL